ncbi:MAG: type IV secretory system conjugative DNA transfer family protein [Candidatus Pacearchaeota archaeon]|nr:type IV secretory system conjugative DNA transfer family protein [Candidatus Pacearchaeota archaeon]
MFGKKKKLTSFLDDIPRGDPSRYLHEQSVPLARWQTPKDIQKSDKLEYSLQNPGKKILLGAMGDKLVGIEDNRHILTVAGSRSGKSVSIIGNLLFYKGSVLATDPKGELANITALRRQELGQKVYILDPFKTASDKLTKFRKAFNPMSVLTADNPTMIEDAGLISDALVVAAGKDPHWDESAKQFIEGLLLHVSTAPEHESERNLVTVRKLIKDAMKVADDVETDEDDEPPYALEEAMLENAELLSEHPDTQDIADAILGASNDFFEREDKERSSVLSTVRRHTKFLDYTAMRSVLTGHDFDLTSLKSDPNGISVYLCLPASRMSVCSRWFRLFVNQLLVAMEQVKSEPSAPVLVCLDEFPVLGYMKQLEDAAGQIASFHVKLWIVLQDWGQGKALYKERWETFAGNAGILQFFGNNDLITTEYISKRLGKTPVKATKDSEVAQKQQESGNTGKSDSLELYDLMTPEEISRFFARSDKLKRQLIILPGYHPFILQRIEYYDETSQIYRYLARHSDVAIAT